MELHPISWLSMLPLCCRDPAVPIHSTPEPSLPTIQANSSVSLADTSTVIAHHCHKRSTSKTKRLVFPPNPFSISVNILSLCPVERDGQSLGFIFDFSLSFSPHIQSAASGRSQWLPPIPYLSALAEASRNRKKELAFKHSKVWKHRSISDSLFSLHFRL